MKKASLLFLLSFVFTLSIAQKKVLFEKYTNAFCGICPDATIQLKNMVEENPDVIWISHQKPIGFMVGQFIAETLPWVDLPGNLEH